MRIFLIALTLMMFSCKKTYTTNVIAAPKSPTVRTLPGNNNDTIFFRQDQNITFIQSASPDTEKIMNIWLSSDSAIVGTVANVYCDISKGTKINIVCADFGTAFKIYNNINTGATMWYYNIVYDGNFNGDRIYRVNIYTY